MAEKSAEKPSDKVIEKKPAPPAEPLRFTPQKQRDLEAAISTITKSFGDGAIMRLGTQVIRPIEVIPTGA